jgi:hypothetical protein
MQSDVPDDLSEEDWVRVEMVDGYWLEGEVEETEGHIEIRDRKRKSRLPEPDDDGDYRPNFVAVKPQLLTNSDGQPTFRPVDLDEGEFEFRDSDKPLEAEVVYIDRDTGDWPAVTLGEVATFEKLE